MVGVAAFRRYVKQGLSPTPDVEVLIRAATRYVGDFMEGFKLENCPEFDEWQFFQREELRQTLARVLRKLTDHFEVSSSCDEALRYARRWLALDVLHEPAHRGLITLYARTGQRAAAERQYRECVRILNEELGIPPGKETVALYDSHATVRPGRR